MLDIPLKYKSIKIIESISWKEIFYKWREGEAKQESWKRHWKERGYSSWKQWRVSYVAPIRPEKLNWFLAEVGDPFREVPNFFGVPSKGWIDHAYGGQISKRLKDLSESSIIKDNDKILAIQKDFPTEVMIIGLIWQNDIILVEGMHRACALVDWDRSKRLKSKVLIALAVWSKKEIPIIGSERQSR
jgi:hypothetical protein